MQKKREVAAINSTIYPGALCGCCRAVQSKSYAHRHLICSALSEGDTVLELSSVCDDVKATLDCLSALGASFNQNGNELLVKPISEKAKSAELNCGESGSTLRFLLPVAAAISEKSSFFGTSGLKARPVLALLEAMRANGAKISGNALPLELLSGMRGGKYVLPGNISSQYVSGLLMALPLLNADSEISIEGRLESAPYVDITIDTLKAYGIFIEQTDSSFYIKGKQKYKSPGRVNIEGDWSAAAFLLTAGALSGEVSVSGLNLSSAQGDRRIVELLERFGAELVCKKDTVTARKSRLVACDIDAADTPDLFPALCVAACAAEGESRFSGFSRLRLKESDRLHSVSNLISALGGRSELCGDRFSVFGSPLKGGRAECRGDHRVAMAAAIAALICSGSTELLGSECVSKSYPAFFEDFAALGGVVSYNI